jgi:transglutaminase-like putative cysteine protease
MSFNRYFITSSYALFTMSFVMLAATGQVDIIISSLFIGVLAAGWLIDSGKLHWSVSPKIANWMLPGYLPFAIIEWQILGVSPVTLIIQFIFFASSLKLLRTKTNRDWLWLYIVSFCQVLMAAGMMISTTFLLLLILYLFAAISTFVSNEIRRSQEVFEANLSTWNGAVQSPEIQFFSQDEKSQLQPVTPRWRTLSYFSAGILVLILLVAVPVFLAMPRLTRGFSRNGLLATETLSGFSDIVRLGEVGEIKLNPQVVMRVRVKFSKDERKTALMWRGVTLDHYDGRTWSESGAGPEPVKKLAESFRVDERPAPSGFTYQRFYVEPLSINTVFVAPRPLYLMGLPVLARDSGDGLWTEAHPFNKIDYYVASDTRVPADAELAADNTRVYPIDFRRRYLQLPLDFDRRIDELAAEVTRGATTQLEIARRIEEYLRNEYSYTLDLQRVEDGDPVADFLFNYRAGHCEYFASAMVLMLRSRRVPARLVNGFQMGEYNESSDFYTVRQSDAHSWVEIFFPKNGWVAFDPTPPAGRSVYDNGVMAWFRNYRESFEMFWFEHVVGFDTGKQLSIALAVQRWLWSYQRNTSSQWLDWVYDFAQQMDFKWMNTKSADGGTPGAGQESDSPVRSLFRPLTLSLFGLAALFAMAFVWHKHRTSWRRKIGNDATVSAVAFYQEMLRTLERRGYKRELHQTPQEFAARLAIPGVTEITRLYQRTRFGRESLTGEEVVRVETLMREMKEEGRPGTGGRRPDGKAVGKDQNSKGKKADC